MLQQQLFLKQLQQLQHEHEQEQEQQRQNNSSTMKCCKLYYKCSPANQSTNKFFFLPWRGVPVNIKHLHHQANLFLIQGCKGVLIPFSWHALDWDNEFYARKIYVRAQQTHLTHCNHIEGGRGQPNVFPHYQSMRWLFLLLLLFGDGPNCVVSSNFTHSFFTDVYFSFVSPLGVVKQWIADVSWKMLVTFTIGRLMVESLRCTTS
jgi:hypothetical protein